MLARIFEAKKRVFVFSARAASGYASRQARSFRLLPAFGVQAVSEGAFAAVVNHQLNQEGLGLIVTPTWNTTVFWTSSLPDSTTFGFGSPALPGSQIFWEASIMPIQNVPVNDQFVVIAHNKNNIAIPIFLTATWNTTVFDSTPDRTANTARFYFGSSAQGTNPQVAWRVAE